MLCADGPVTSTFTEVAGICYQSVTSSSPFSSLIGIGLLQLDRYRPNRLVFPPGTRSSGATPTPHFPPASFSPKMILTNKEVSTEHGAIQARVRIDHLAGGAADSGTVAHFPSVALPAGWSGTR